MSANRVRQVFGLVGVVLISKVVGLAREVVIADRFGTSSDYDLYLIAVMLPALAWGVISFASYYFFVPYLTKILAGGSGDEKQTWSSVWSLLNITILGSLGITMLLMVAGPYVLPFWAKGYQHVDFDKVVFYGRVTAAIVLFGATEAFLRALLNVRGVFSYTAWGLIFCNVAMIAVTVLLASALGAGAIVLGLLAGLVTQNLFLLLRVISMSHGRWSPMLERPDLRLIFATGGLLVAIELLNRSYFLIDRYFAAPFGEGIISALNYGQVLVQLPDAIVGFSIASVVFPLFSESRSPEDRSRFGRLFHESAISGLLIAVPVAVAVYLNARDVVYLLFSRGAFDQLSVATTAAVLQPYAPTIAALFLISTSLRACYALDLARDVLIATVLALAVKFVATWWLPTQFGYPGISMATTVSQVCFAASLLMLILRRMQREDRMTLVAELGKIVMAGLVCFGVAHYADFAAYWKREQPDRLISIARVAMSTVVVFGLFLAVAVSLGMKKHMARVFHRHAN